MAQTISTLSNRVSTGQESLLQGVWSPEGVRRSRFSLHFKTWRTRRWLLVQWVSAPVQATGEWLEGIARRLSHEQSRPTLSSALDQYQLDSTLRRTI
jgi:hypothetical protein